MSKKNVMNQVILALNSGFDDKALSILNHNDKNISTNEMKEITIFALKFHKWNIFFWIYLNSVHRFDLMDYSLHYQTLDLDSKYQLFTIHERKYKIYRRNLFEYSN